ncbi:MAG: glycine cleavage system protein GcvH [Cyanobacteria bacterium]|nr:glycine cleavage system protein GcvH [Cyanobacteriota bacterium]MDW8200349.1 glycine cleavage system protein GcvH [Cyanobacteriota bacterium SKYGB_h_bin112]
MALDYPDDVKYLDTHEYVRLDGDIATVGISAYAIDQLGDIVFLELADIGKALAKGDTFGNIESVKVAEDLYSPVSGVVIERNTRVLEAIDNAESPDQLVNDPYGEGWLIKLQITDPSELTGAMSADDYRLKVEGTK